MHFYSSKLRYSLFLVSVNVITFTSMIHDNAKVIEITEGEITERDFPFSNSIASFTVRENVSVKYITTNAFAENENLKTVSK